MKGRTTIGNKGVRTEDAIHSFLRDSALVKEHSGEPALTNKGERFLQELQGWSSRSTRGSRSPDGPSFSEGTTNI